MKFNKNQQEAIDFEGQNILVSAGAGSGKTAVLTARILRKLKDGVSIDELVIITFTKAAAAEMKERIKSQIEEEVEKGNKKLEIELQKLETANISTFDSFSLNLLKTYHYRMNISKDIKIGEGLIFNLKTQEIVDQYFHENLDSKILKYYGVSGKNSLYTQILSSYSKYSINIDYVFKDEVYINDYYSLLRYEVAKLIPLIDEIDLDTINEEDNKKTKTDKSDYDKYVEKVSELKTLLTKNDEELYEALIFHDKNRLTLSRKKIYSENNEKIKKIREEAKDLFNMLNHYEYDESIVERDFQFVEKNYKEEIKKIFEYIDKNLFEFKYENNMFDFIDVSKMVIQLLKENPDIVKNLKEKINEVLIDEYQDTVSYQEELIRLITHNNIFMVGDIKQAIYGFRNATPESFNKALKDKSCKKIFLNYNYRSGKNVIDDINHIFKKIMDYDSGGVDYDDEQCLIYGNKSFDTIAHDGVSFIKYDLDGNKHEIEAQLMANDILEKQATKGLKFSDFAILCRSKSQFETYAKVLKANGINVNIFSDVEYISSFEIMLIKNLFELVIDPTNRFAKASVLRSFLYQHDDEKIAEISDFDIDIRPPYKVNNYQLYYYLINKLKILEKIKYLESPIDSFIRLRYTFDLMKNFDDLNYSLEEVVKFFDDIKEMGKDITFTNEKSTDMNAVKMMTIHKSKGLQFKVVYMPNVDKKFNIMDLNDHISFTQKYGLIVHKHFEKDNVLYSRPTYDSKLYRIEYLKSLLAEEMRLLYVAMTRAEQDFIFICNDEYSEKDTSNQKTYMRWVAPFMTIGEVFSEVDIKNIVKNEKSNDSKTLIDFKEHNVVPLKMTQKRRASQLSVEIVDEEQNALIEEGNKLHVELEYIDFTNLENYDSKLVNNLRQHDLFTSIEKYYTEFEYMHNNIHGIIDLLIENNDEVIIVDYKLKNIDKEEYVTQLNSYEEYIKTVTNKKISKYLYSIKENRLKKI